MTSPHDKPDAGTELSEARLRELQTHFHRMQISSSWSHLSYAEAVDAKRAIDELLSRREAVSEPVPVRPLIWYRHARDDIERYTGEGGEGGWIAYHITRFAGRDDYELYMGYWGSAAAPKFPAFATADEAKAAAQQDYETRIRSALALPLSGEAVPREAAQGEIDGLLVARMVMEFQRALRDTYGHDVMTSSLCAVGPLQSMIGLAIKNGHLALITKEQPAK